MVVIPLAAAVVVIVAIVVVGSIRMESDASAQRPRFRPLNQLIGFGLVAGLVCGAIVLSVFASRPTPYWAAGLLFLLEGLLFVGSSLIPQNNSVFWYLASLAEVLPWRGAHGRSGLLLLGILLGALGVCLTVAGSGILG